MDQNKVENVMLSFFIFYLNAFTKLKKDVQ